MVKLLQVKCEKGSDHERMHVMYRDEHVELKAMR
jgi:hypothetical protein